MKTRNFKFKDFLKRSKIPIEIEDSIKYKRVKIRIKHGGVSLRDEELGKNIGTKKQFILKDGQFVLSKIDARYGAFGIADESVNNAIITGNFWAYDVDFNLIDIDWFNQLTNSQDFYDLCERSSTGITHRKYLNEAAFLNNEINLPSLEDQKKSVTRIENFKFNGNLNSTELKNQLSLISQLRQAFLKEAMQGKLVSNETSDGKTGADLLAEIQSEKQKLIKEKKIKKQKPLPPISEEEIPFNIPENWVWCRLGEIISDTEGGKSPNCENVAVKGDDWGVIKTTAIQENAFLDFENKKLPKGFQVKENYIVKLNDILITRAGPKNRVGILCLVEKNDYNLILSDKTIRMNVLKGKLNSKFITYALNSKTLKPFVESKMTGMADSQVNISQDNIKMIPIILPPLEIQNRIVSKLEELMTSCDDLETSVKESQNYNEQLLQQVLREALEVKEIAKKEILPLVAEEKPIYSISNNIVKICNTGDMAILAGYIIKKLSTQNSKDFGRVKLQKMLHLTEYHCQLSTELRYQKNVAGPYSSHLEYSIEPKLKAYRFFDIKKEKLGNNSKVTYTPLPASNGITSLFKNEFKDQAESINHILDKFQDKTWEFCEMISTMYAVWNNRLIRKELFTDDLLKKDFLEWDKEKVKFIDQLNHAIDWIRKENIEPMGFGEYIDVK